MKYALVLVMLIVPSCWGQTGQAQTKGVCSPAITGKGNSVTINCGIGQQQGQKMVAILNKILANQLDADAVMAKLDEILKAVNPNLPVKTYFCDGKWRTAGPGANAGMELAIGGDDSDFQNMVTLNNTGRYGVLLTACLDQIRAKPEWLTPRLFCGLSYLSQGDKEMARAMLAEFDSRTGPAYSQGACKQMADLLHSVLK